MGCIYIVCIAIIIGAGTYTLSSRVVPHDVRRRGLAQENPCPGDTVEFTCTRSESSAAIVRWIADETPLYTFLIPDDLTTSPYPSHMPGFTGALINETTLTLSINLTATVSVTVVNGTRVVCGNAGRNVSQILSIIGNQRSQ